MPAIAREFLSFEPRIEVVAYRCRAHRKNRQRVCGNLLGFLPKILHFVGTTPTGPVAPRTIATLPCSRCNHWNLFDILPQEHA